MLLVLLLVLTSAVAVNAEGIKDIFGAEKGKEAKGDVTYNLVFVNSQYNVCYDEDEGQWIKDGPYPEVLCVIKDYDQPTITLTNDIFDQNAIYMPGNLLGSGGNSPDHFMSWDTHTKVDLATYFESGGSNGRAFAGWFSNEEAAYSGYELDGEMQHVDLD